MWKRALHERCHAGGEKYNYGEIKISMIFHDKIATFSKCYCFKIPGNHSAVCHFIGKEAAETYCEEAEEHEWHMMPAPAAARYTIAKVVD